MGGINSFDPGQTRVPALTVQTGTSPANRPQLPIPHGIRRLRSCGFEDQWKVPKNLVDVAKGATWWEKAWNLGPNMN